MRKTYRELARVAKPDWRGGSGWLSAGSAARRAGLEEEAMAGDTFDNRPGVIWYDGTLVPWSDATMHVLSHGLHYASCVFEGERAYGGEIYKCTEHSERLKA